MQRAWLTNKIYNELRKSSKSMKTFSISTDNHKLRFKECMDNIHIPQTLQHQNTVNYQLNDKVVKLKKKFHTEDLPLYLIYKSDIYEI